MMRISLVCLLLLALTKAQQPNIVWIVCEDISPTLSMYGDSTAHTPVLDRLAAESVVYEHAFATVAVCAPSRSSIITGMYPTAIGTMHMRTGKDIQSWGRREYAERIPAVDLVGDSLRQYAAVLPPEVKCFPQYLRAAGYFCSNNQKTDYQFAAPLAAWDKNSPKAHWRNRPEGKPFFSVFNIGTTHESRLWKHKDKPLTVSPETVPVPPYLCDDSISRRTIARHYSNEELMDKEVGDIIAQLKADGLYDNSYIFFYSDHGGPLPRQKRAPFDSGLRVPFMVKMPKGEKRGRSERLISFVDLAPTLLSLAGIQPPGYMDGRAFLGVFEGKPRSYVFASSDRFDEHSDRLRMLRNERFLYVWSHFPEKAHYKDINYRKQVPLMQQMLRARAEGSLDSLQKQWFEPKAERALYDCQADPHNLHNLIDDPAYREQAEQFQLAFQRMAQQPDLGMIPEAQLIEMMWSGGEQPQTDAAQMILRDGDEILLNCNTAGASLVYLWSDSPGEQPGLHAGWKLYHKPLMAREGKFLYVLAERIGYEASELRVFGF